MSSELLPYSFSTAWHHPKSDETMPNALSGKANTAIAVAISNVVRNLFIILFEIKKACNHPFACLSSGYRQVTCIQTSTGQSTPLGREPPVCLFSVCESLAVFDEREQEPKAQYLCFVQVLENVNARWFVDFVCCVRLKPVGGLCCASACSRAFRVGVCLLASFLLGGLCCKYTAFSLLLQRIWGKSVHAGAFFVMSANRHPRFGLNEAHTALAGFRVC